MTSALKPFGESGTGSRHNVFLIARLKLTALYVGIVAVIVFVFSLFLFQSIVLNLKDGSDDDFVGAKSRAHFMVHAIPPIRDTFLISDICIILGAAGLSYLLAGKTLEPVERALEAQRIFAAQASHELRTPLAVMRNDTEIALRNARTSSVELRATLTSNLEEIQHMSALVQDLLILARSEHATLQAPEPVNLSEIISTAVAKVIPLGDSKKISITFPNTQVFTVRGNASALERVFLNLLQNSVEHSEKGTVITIETQAKKAQVLVRVMDTGNGIAPEDLPHIFNRFYKGQLGAEKNGSGLGLAIVKEIITQHGGTIAIASTLGNGTVVELTFPRA